MDGDGAVRALAGQMLFFGLAGCMSADIVDIVRKGRHR